MATRTPVPKQANGTQPGRWRPWLRRSWSVKVRHRDGYRLTKPEQAARLIERDPVRCTVHFDDGEFLVDRDLS